MSENQKNTSEIWATPESNQDILARQPVSVQKIVEKDQILSKNLDQISNPKEFFEKLAQNAHIFEKTDNLSAQKTFLEQSLKGLEYWQYTKDGRDFSKLTPEEVKGLSDDDYDKYNEWKLAEKKAKLITTTKAADKEEMKVITEDQRFAENKEKAITEDQRFAENRMIVIELTEKNKIAWEENQKIIDTLSSNWKSLINSEFQKARTDAKNPVYQDLVSKGVDPSKGEFDNILRASIILSNADTLRKESGDQSKFDSSISELGKLWIPYPVASDIPGISAHIDSRFPRGEATERAKWEITRSIESGNVANLYYDGKWEKYTLMDKDGKTSKEVYMNPPRIRVRESTLSYEFPIYKNKDISERTGKKELLTGIKEANNSEAMRFLNTLTKWEDAQKKQDAIKEIDPIKLQELKTSLSSIMSSATPSEERRVWAENIRTILGNIRTMPRGLFDPEGSQLTDLIAGLKKEQDLQKSINSLPPEANTPEKMEKIVRDNLSLLTLHKFDAIGPDAQEALDRMIALQNRWRTRNNEIRLDKPIEENSNDFNKLKKDLSKLGITQESTKSDTLGSIQRNISSMLQYNPSDSRSIEGKLQEKPKSDPI